MPETITLALTRCESAHVLVYMHPDFKGPRNFGKVFGGYFCETIDHTVCIKEPETLTVYLSIAI